ncbi:MAG: response regulator transcription factor [Chloroflexi bacterium]|nr:response regulator transcription factor [Chloroflexota bacterium]
MLLDAIAVPAKLVLEVLSWCRDEKLPVLVVLDQNAMGTYDVAQGADDFVLEPLQSRELIARINQLLWRLKGKQGKDILRVGDLAIDQERYEVSVAGRSVVLTFKEYELLSLLASSPGRVFTRDILLSKVWGYDYFGGTRTVDVHVRRLRSKIEDARHTFIETIWNVGYRMKDLEE